MKNKILWIGSVFILILSIVCFVVFGVGTELIRAISGDGNGISFGTYDGKSIELAPGSDFANAVQNYTNYFERQLQTENPQAHLTDNDYFYIYNYAFNAAVQNAAYSSEVKKSGYKPSRKAISRELLPYFLNEERKYDPRLYNSVSAADRESMNNSIGRQLIYQRYADDMFGSSKKLGKNTIFGIQPSTKEITCIQSIGADKRSFDMVAFNKADYPQSEIQSFGNENKDLFSTYSLSVITVKNGQQAKKIQSQLVNNEITFEDAVSEYSEKYYSDGDGKITENFEYQIKENLANPADFSHIAAVEENGISDVITTKQGFSIYKNTGSKTPADIENEETLEAVKKYITMNESGRIEDYFMDKANMFIANEAVDGFDKAASSMGTKKISVPAFPLNYGDASVAAGIPTYSVPELAGASTNEHFLTKAFSLSMDEVSEPILVGNYIIILKLTGIQTENAENDISEVLSEYDMDSAQSAILTSDKVENNVASVYFNTFLSK